MQTVWCRTSRCFFLASGLLPSLKTVGHSKPVGDYPLLIWGWGMDKMHNWCILRSTISTPSTAEAKGGKTNFSWLNHRLQLSVIQIWRAKNIDFRCTTSWSSTCFCSLLQSTHGLPTVNEFAQKNRQATDDISYLRCIDGWSCNLFEPSCSTLKSVWFIYGHSTSGIRLHATIYNCIKIWFGTPDHAKHGHLVAVDVFNVLIK